MIGALVEMARDVRARVSGPYELGSGGADGLFSDVGADSAAGVSVSATGAMSTPAVLACVRAIAETLAMVPLHVLKESTKGRKRREHGVEHPLYDLLHLAPNGEMTSFEFREWVMSSILARGNGYAEVEWERGQVKALWPLLSQKVRMDRVSGRLMYFVMGEDGVEHALPPQRVLHIKGWSLEGLTGWSLVGLGREAIGTALAQEQSVGEFYSNGAMPLGALIHPSGLTPKAARNIRRDFESIHRGLGQAHRVAVLAEGMKYEQVGIDPAAAQLLEGRTFQVAEVARIFRMPLHMVQELSRATFSNIEQQAKEFVDYTMGPWVQRWEQRMETQLLLPSERTGDERFYCRFNLMGLLRGDSAARSEFYAKLFEIGAFTPNDVRDLEDMNPMGPEGDIASVQLNRMALRGLLEGGMDGTDSTATGTIPNESGPSADDEGDDDDPGPGSGGANPVNDGDSDTRGGACSASRRGAFEVGIGKSEVGSGIPTCREEEERAGGGLVERGRLRRAWRGVFERAGRAARARAPPAAAPVIDEWVEVYNRKLSGAFDRKDVAGIGAVLDEMWRNEGVGPGAGGVLGKRYKDAVLTNTFARGMGGVFQEFAGAIGPVAARAAGLDPGEWMARTEAIEDFVYEYGWQRAQSSIGQLQKIARAYSGGGMMSVEAAEAIQAEILTRMAEWQNGGPGGSTWAEKTAEQGVTQADGFIARDIWRRAGMKRVVWRTVGDNCPLCQMLDGKVVSLERDEAFLPKGMMLDPELGIVEIDNDRKGTEGRPSPIRAGADVLHPPLHRGCDCFIEVSGGRS